MEARPIPQKLIDQGLGQPMHFVGPKDAADVGDLWILNVTDPAQVRAILMNRPPPVPPGSTDFWVSWWEPNDLERHQLATGAPVRLTFIGCNGVPPMRMDVGANLDGLEFKEAEDN